MTRLRPHLPLIAILVLTTLIALPILTYPLGRDQGEFAVIGRGLLQGKAPYTDLWNPKPPAIFLVYAGAMALFGQTAAAPRAIDLLIVPPIIAALYWIGRRLFDALVALWAALLFPVFYYSETFWTLTQNDGIVLLPMVLAIVCALKAAEASPRAWRWALACGALMGVIFWFKYPFALFASVLVTAYLSSLFPSSLWNKHFSCFTAFVAGLAVVLLTGALWLVQIGAWEAFIESARVTAGYTALGLDGDSFRDLMTTALSFRWAYWGLLFVLAGVGIVGVLLDRKDSLAKRGTGAAKKASVALHLHAPASRSFMVLLWLLVGLAMMLVQLRGYDYHWLPILPPLVLLGGIGVAWVDSRIRRWLQRTPHEASLSTLSPVGTPHEVSVHAYPSGVPLLIALLLLLIPILNIYPRAWAYLTGQEDQTAYYDRFVAGEFVAGESLRVADYLRARTVPGDSLYIWGFRPEIYALTQLNPPTRFIFQFPLVGDWYPAAWRQENVDILWAALPPYVLVMQVDYLPWVTGSDDDSNTLLQHYTELNDWLIYNYERDTQIGNVFVWKRKLALP
ncbi:MAG: glycosyltransferase family 39 protein [Chloroflexota bacterium]|nr:glycosyltransferase family 39 protein [Chloroflexota bacterium]